MARSSFAQLIDSNSKVIPGVANRGATGSITILRTGFAQPIAETEAFGSELVTNGDCELTTGWSAVGAPTSQARSDEQAHAGTYSWKLVAAGGGITGFGQTISLTAGKLYKISFWYMKSAGVLCARLGSGAGSTPSFQLLTDGASASWANIIAYYIAETGNDGALQFYDDSAATVYVDDVTVKEITSTPQKSLWVYLSVPSTNSGAATISLTPTGTTFNGLIFPAGAVTSHKLKIDMAEVRLFVSGTAADVLKYFAGYAE